MQIFVGLVVPFVCFTIKFTVDETNAKFVTSPSSEELQSSGDVTGNSNDVMAFSSETPPSGKETKPGEPPDDAEQTKSRHKKRKTKRKKMQLLTGNKFVYALYYFYTAPVVKFSYYVVSVIFTQTLLEVHNDSDGDSFGQCDQTSPEFSQIWLKRK